VKKIISKIEKMHLRQPRMFGHARYIQVLGTRGKGWDGPTCNDLAQYETEHVKKLMLKKSNAEFL
jgi:hypothetical protein